MRPGPMVLVVAVVVVTTSPKKKSKEGQLPDDDGGSSGHKNSSGHKHCALAFLPTDDWAAKPTTTAHVRLHSDYKLARKRQGCPQTATVLQRRIDGDGSTPIR